MNPGAAGGNNTTNNGGSGGGSSGGSSGAGAGGGGGAGGIPRKMGRDAFQDLLGGFQGSGGFQSHEPRTMNDMRRAQKAKSTDPDVLKVRPGEEPLLRRSAFILDDELCCMKAPILSCYFNPIENSTLADLNIEYSIRA